MAKIYFSMEEEEKVLNKCPICGSKLEYSALYQYEKVFGIKKDGTLTSKPKLKRDVGSMECGFISCTNEECDFHTNCDLEVEDYDNIDVFLDGLTYMYTETQEE